jgi:hypothetical protein
MRGEVSSIVSSNNCMDGRESWKHEIHKSHEPLGGQWQWHKKGPADDFWAIRTRL